MQDGGSIPFPHHITIKNCTVHHTCGGGIYSVHGDYLTIQNNTVHDCANWSTYGCSGISVGSAKNFDTGPAPHIVVKGNTSYNNAQMVGSNGPNNPITDGEGIIADVNDETSYTGGILIDGNTCYSNGNPGIESFRSKDVVITNNHVYSNSTQGRFSGTEAQIFINQSANNTVSNNNLSP